MKDYLGRDILVGDTIYCPSFAGCMRTYTVTAGLTKTGQIRIERPQLMWDGKANIPDPKTSVKTWLRYPQHSIVDLEKRRLGGLFVTRLE